MADGAADLERFRVEHRMLLWSYCWGALLIIRQFRRDQAAQRALHSEVMQQLVNRHLRLRNLADQVINVTGLVKRRNQQATNPRL